MKLYAHEEAAFEAKAEKMLAGQREVPNGRNFLAWTMRFQNNKAYKSKRFDDTFGATTGSDEWLDKLFCAGCGKRHHHCECEGK